VRRQRLGSINARGPLVNTRPTQADFWRAPHWSDHMSAVPRARRRGVGRGRPCGPAPPPLHHPPLWRSTRTVASSRMIADAISSGVARLSMCLARPPRRCARPRRGAARTHARATRCSGSRCEHSRDGRGPGRAPETGDLHHRCAVRNARFPISLHPALHQSATNLLK
jgi:hypothetical protein